CAKPDYVMQRYRITKRDKVLITVCRLSSAEKYKGYDKVIEVFPEILHVLPDTRYILAGKYDENEKKRISAMLKSNSLGKNVILAGFIPENELSDHYKLGDLFVMPSQGEGFGIVYLEAMACGIPVLTGNKDGSKELVEKLNIGFSVDPDNKKALSLAIISMLQVEKTDKNSISVQVEDIFGFSRFKARVAELVLHKLEKIEA
ncbi:MAG: glycosyltransferase, partial [Bacteroidia bacterium]